MEAVGSWFRKDDVKTVFHFLSLGLAWFLSAPAQWYYVAFSGEKRIQKEHGRSLKEPEITDIVLVWGKEEWTSGGLPNKKV